MSVRPWTVPRFLPALLGWSALAATLLPAGNPLRALLAGAFLLAGPGTAMVGCCRPFPLWVVRGPARLTMASLVVALSLATALLTAELLFFRHVFTPTRTMLALAVLTTVLVLLPGRRPLPGGRGTPAPGAPAGPSPAGRRRTARLRVWSVACLVLATAACGTATGAGGAPHEQGLPQGAGAVTQVAADLPPAPGLWRQVFRDDFNGPGLDHGKWVTCYDWNQGGCTNAGNKEDQWYLPDQVAVTDGELVLTAERRPTPGGDGRTYPWTSGMVSTGRDHWDGTPRATFTYGYFAVAMRVPEQAVGMFPAFWLLNAPTRGGLPELDVAEFINTNRFVDLNFHGETPDGTEVDAHYAHGPADFAAGHHVFGLDWQPDAITWYVDGVERFKVTDPSVIPSTPMELIVNLAVGYQQSPPPDVDSARLRVEWVGVWQH